MAKKNISKLDLNDKRVLIRVDFNVPLTPEGGISDDRRIRMALPTIQEAVRGGGKVILVSHLGRPKGKPDPKFSLKLAAERLEELLGRPVAFVPDCVGPEVEKAVAGMNAGDVAVLENLRFHKGETKNEADFARALRNLCDLYVDDAFGTAHRTHASMYGVPAQMPEGTKAIGFLIEKELEFLGGALDNPRQPFVTILGGVKVSDKVGAIENLVKIVDRLLIGGAMTYTLMLAKGQGVGNSKVEKVVEKKDGTKLDVIALAGELLAKAEASRAELLLPVDHLVARKVEADAETVVQGPEIEEGWIGVDIGPKTIEMYKAALADAGTVVWNGPMGVFEKPPFAEGTRAIVECVAGLDATTIIGGGDTASAVEQFGMAECMSHVSTGGGASLKFLDGKPFESLEVIDEV